METYDIIFIGSGHNALIAASYLARAGRSVLILERNDRPGGLVRTDELTLPGFKHDTFSSAHPLFLSGPAYADLGSALTERGLRYVNTDLPTGVSMEDGQTAVLPRSMEALVAEAERLAPGDGERITRLLDSLNPYTNDVFSLFRLDLTSAEATAIITRMLHDGDHPGYSLFASSLFETACTVVDPLRSAVLRAMFAPWVTHMGLTPDEIGSGIWVKLFILALMGGGMAIPEGGSERLVHALAQLIEDQGGVIRVKTPVRRIIVEQGRASKVRTANNEEFRARQAIVASTNPDQLYLSLLAESDVPASLREQAKRYRYGRGCVQIHLALSEPPHWPDERFNRVGQPHLTDGLNEGTLAFAQGRAGLLPTKPTFTVACQTSLDPSRAPAGKATMRLQLMEIPCRPIGDAAGKIDVGDGTWTHDLTERFTERIIDIVSKHIPNIAGAIIGHAVVTPDTLAQFSPNQGPGDAYGGARDFAQNYVFSPLPGRPGHVTTIPNLFMLGAATWPGPGVNGNSGYIVAQKLLNAH